MDAPLRRPLLLAALLATVSAISTAGERKQAVRQHIEPALEPKSHETFFNKDYPDDQSPTQKHKLSFNYPYPVVQDSEDYDKDYVKDENGDKGEWHAQMSYDSLRVKMKKEREDVEKALKKEKVEEEELEKLKKEEAEAEAASKEAEAKATAAKEREAAAEAEVERLIGKKAASEHDDGKEPDEVGGAIGEEVKSVSKEIKDVEGCQKQLEDAKEKLKKALEEKRTRDEAHAKLKAELEKNRDDAESNYTKARDADYERMAEGLRKKVRQEEEEYNEAEHLVKMSAEEVRKTEEALKKATDRLRKFRHSKVDPDGGVYYKDGARAAAPTLVVSLLGTLALLSL